MSVKVFQCFILLHALCTLSSFDFLCCQDLDSEFDILQSFTWEELLSTEVGTKDVQVGVALLGC